MGTEGAGTGGGALTAVVAPTHICTAVLTATKSGQGPWKESPSWPQLPVRCLQAASDSPVGKFSAQRSPHVIHRAQLGYAKPSFPTTLTLIPKYDSLLMLPSQEAPKSPVRTVGSRPAGGVPTFIPQGMEVL